MLINKNRRMLICALLMQLLFMQTAEADIFKCTSTKGDIYYNDKPCSVKDEQKKMKVEKDIKSSFNTTKTPLKTIKEDTLKKIEIKSQENSIQSSVKNKKKRPNGKRPSAEEERLLFIDTHAGSSSDSNEMNYFKNKTN